MADCLTKLGEQAFELIQGLSTRAQSGNQVFATDVVKVRIASRKPRMLFQLSRARDIGICARQNLELVLQIG